MRKIINVIVFQTVWFAAVLGAAHGIPWLGVAAVLAAFAIHLALSPNRISELLLALGAAVIGFTADSGLIAGGAFSPVPYVFPAPFSSLWMVMLWVNFAATINVSMAWLRGRYVIAFIFGAIGGPMAYYSGAKLGAMNRMPELIGLLAIGITWAFVTPLLYRMAKVLNDRYAKH